MKVWCNGTDTVCAEDIDDVRKVLIEVYGDGHDVTEYMNEGFYVVPDDEPITIVNYDDHCTPKTLTAAEWAARDGRGLLCSTEY